MQARKQSWITNAVAWVLMVVAFTAMSYEQTGSTGKMIKSFIKAAWHEAMPYVVALAFGAWGLITLWLLAQPGQI